MPSTFRAAITPDINAAALTFLGPVLGSLIQPLGGALADRYQGSVVTFWNFVAMAAGAAVVLLASQQNSLPLFLVGSVMLFIFSGIGNGNGSVYKMIPAIFTAKALTSTERAGEDGGVAARLATRRSGALIGLAGAIGAFGGVLVNLVFRQSFLTLKNGNGTYLTFIIFYAICFAVTWAVLIRPREGRLNLV